MISLYRLGLRITTCFRWWKLADWFWYKKFEAFEKIYPLEKDYYDKNGFYVMTTGW